MIKTYCDFCGNEIIKDSKFNVHNPIETKMPVHGTRNLNLVTIKISSISTPGNDICKKCIFKAISNSADK